MTWLCWLIGHNWGQGMDETVDVCQRCLACKKHQVVEPKKRFLPLGAAWCPYPDCRGYGPIPYDRTPDGKGSWINYIGLSVLCNTCKKYMRFERDEIGAEWKAPRISA